MSLNTTADEATWSLHDYISPGLRVVRPDDCFPHMRPGDSLHHPWKYLRRDVPHRWYADERFPLMGFLNRDEAVLLHNIALQFAGRRALEIGSWLGWSTCHLAMAGVLLDVIDPAHQDPVIRASVEDSLRRCGIAERVHLARGRSPESLAELKQRWSLFFIDGDHEAPAPLRDTAAALAYATDDCAFVFHDLASPAVAAPLRFLQEKGFNVVVYQTAQIMALAWRGDVAPVAHVPDPEVAWQLPPHLAGLPISGFDVQLRSRPEYSSLRERTYGGAESRPSVCIVTSELIGPFKNGGVGTSMTGLAELLAHDGFPTTVLYTGAIWQPEVRLEPWVKHYAARGIELIALSIEETKTVDGPLRDIGFVQPWLVYQRLRRRRFDVIHFNDCCGEGSLALAAKALGIAFDDSLLAVALHSPSRWVFDLNHILPATRACAAFDYSERLSLACADLLWSPSRYLLDWVASRGFELPRQTCIQQYVMPEPPASDIVHGRTAPPEEIVFFGRLEERKGLRLFCNAVDRLADQLARRGIAVTFLGKAEQCAGMPSLQYIAKRAAGWRFPVRTLTDLGQPEALQYLRAGGKLAVMPSPFDNSPCTVYEALGAGIPFLAARTGGIPELVEKAARDHVLFDYTTEALRNALEDAIEHGGWIARPAVPPEETRRSWREMHAHWQELLPRAGDADRPAATVAAIIDHPAGAPLARTLESLWACPQIDRLIILNRAGEALPYENIDLLSAEAQTIEAELAGLTEDAVLLIHSGVAVLREAFAPMLDALGRARVDGLMPAGRTTGSFGTRVIPPLGGSVAVSLLDGVTSGGALVVRRETLRRGLAGRALAIESPFLGVADFCITRSDRIWPYPEPVVERPEWCALDVRSSLPARIAPYGETSPNDRYYILAAGYEAASRRSPDGWVRRLALAAIDSGFTFAVRAASGGRRRLRSWMRR
ncbi:MAG TPA: class I SAM-dependent methyltransferase [Thermoanaerobaculia bacterium]|jgi:glycosyltransferase involved in cell wall biosynthesis/predicted O-methyltransferase YrrM|nr:class I SAM-dependent methyltransferase [Thermoanaerobaculia bacterium]